ncbi:F-box/kelch-repeat protein At5g26960 [Typha angustifolia]|uniref:F-box/kelch-repeat protein At5g26960 n=1 Tax=Typha angustifolia TaxID=59011 RepID=UPI003C302688
MAESCNSRSFSWLVKSCIPDPRREIANPSSESHRGHRSSVAVVASLAAAPIFSLPDDLLLECLGRVSSSSLPSLPLVCRRFALLLDSPDFFHLRRLHDRLRRSIHAVSVSDLAVLTSATLPLASTAADSWEVTAFPLPFSPQISDGSGSFSHARAVPVGRSVYLIGRGATILYDTWTGHISSRSPTLFPRKKFAAAAIAGKIYVAGGSSRTSAVEEYDPSADEWKVIAEAPRRRYGCVGAAAGGVFYVAGGLRVGSGRVLDAHVCAGSVDAYHVAGRGWLRPRAVPGGGCVVGTCGVGEHVYILASHAVEISFWRWEVGGRGRRGGEWTRLDSPPVPSRVGLGGAVLFSCAAVGADRMAAVVHVSAVRGGTVDEAAASADGAVLVYDIPGGEWTRGPDLPPGFRRAACAGVEC